MILPLRIVFLCVAVSTATFAQPPQSLIREFHNQKGALIGHVLVQRDSTPTTSTHDFTLVNNLGDTVRGSIRVPTAHGGKYPVAVLVVGLETGKEVVKMIEGYNSVIVVAFDYPYAGRLDFSGWNAVKTVFALRDAGFKTVSQILLSLDWIFEHPLADTSDVTIVAVSFGVFTAVPAAVIEKRVKRLVVVQAGGNLSTVVAANAERLEMPLPSWLAGWLGSVILAPFEPNRYIAAFSPRPVLIVSGKSDMLFPRASVQSLYDHARRPKEWILHSSRHVMPGERELINELTQLVAQRLYGWR